MICVFIVSLLFVMLIDLVVFIIVFMLSGELMVVEVELSDVTEVMWCLMLMSKDDVNVNVMVMIWFF